jgi:hypothetical protein
MAEDFICPVPPDHFLNFFLKMLYNIMFLISSLKLFQMSTPLLHGEHKRLIISSI